VFEEKYFDIIADEGIFAKIPDETWNRLEEKLKAEFRAGNYLNGIIHLISEMGEILLEEFPVNPDDVNELPDDIVLN
jgi:putative membrane protein